MTCAVSTTSVVVNLTIRRLVDVVVDVVAVDDNKDSKVGNPEPSEPPTGVSDVEICSVDSIAVVVILTTNEGFQHASSPLYAPALAV
ncbi:hypothetical protein A1F94_012615 [Pyrenophora tritici-repentis]|uniref:Uncharacterized protein n=1 Tax=Pyrenophora tritici-repentis TaxID=45151 RepID=A0A316ZJQ5_9PLEO|nr:hypothetical protein PtrV1_09256 [Pyrenophora tritici-repentis]KAF7443297.1 hypothetical protein A1F99_128040 [Pyrenophora tritici-repentis]KAF7568215.1 hypothetical protein PtrM4_128280 [Pyrenophora tritici-repentis]KAG9377015.1 hypothetical protein A1F94_012615 [Pyrenophora tritici-repentis]KAI0575797.1 hypothetical protein Alg130_09109 [Pyrenophora tritici-repentis]